MDDGTPWATQPKTDPAPLVGVTRDLPLALLKIGPLTVSTTDRAQLFTLFRSIALGISHTDHATAHSGLTSFPPFSDSSNCQSCAYSTFGVGYFFLSFRWGKNRGGAMDKRCPDPQQLPIGIHSISPLTILYRREPRLAAPETHNFFRVFNFQVGRNFHEQCGQFGKQVADLLCWGLWASSSQRLVCRFSIRLALFRPQSQPIDSLHCWIDVD